APNYMARELAPLKQPSPNSRIRYRGSAAHEGGVRKTFVILNFIKFQTKLLAPKSEKFSYHLRTRAP
ncbi:MAG: hypothetical protein O3A59_14485, partial [Nitrospirae bacterium]|nr:hypothetical protein [Nitrospirota bacterium]